MSDDLLHFFFSQGEGLFEDDQTLVHLFLGDAERRGEAHDALAATQQDQAALESQVDDAGAEFLGGGLALAVLDELDADHQSDAAHVADGGMARHDLVQGVDHIGAHGGGVFKVLVLDQIDGSEGSGAGERVAAEGVAVGAARPVHDGIAGDAGAHGHAGSNSLGGGEDIGFHVKMLDRPPLAGAAHPALDLVGDEQDIVLIAKFAQGGEEAGGRDDIAALALDGLDQDAGDLVGWDDMTEDLVLDVADDGLTVILPRLPVQDGAVGVGEGGVDDAVHERVKAAVVGGLAGGKSDGAHGATVEGAGEADEVGPPGVVAGEFNGGLDRFGARVGHKGLGFLPEGSDLVQLFCQLDPFLVVEIRRNMNELLGLVLDGLDHLGMAVTGGDDGDASGEVEEAVAVHIPDLGALAVVHDKGDTARVRG